MWRKLFPHRDKKALYFDTADVRRNLRRVNKWKASDPDNIPGQVLRECVDQLAYVLMDIFNTSLDQDKVSSCFTVTIIPVPKKTSNHITQYSVRELNWDPWASATPLCNWLLDFLTERPQSAQVRQNISPSAQVPVRDEPSAVYFDDTLLRPGAGTKHIVKFADDTTVVGLISEDNDLAYRLVERQEPDPERAQNQRGHCQLQEEPARPCPASTQQWRQRVAPSS